MPLHPCFPSFHVQPIFAVASWKNIVCNNWGDPVTLYVGQGWASWPLVVAVSPQLDSQLLPTTH